MNSNTEHGLGAEIARRLKAKGLALSANSVNNYLAGRHESRFAAQIDAERAIIIKEKIRAVQARRRALEAKLELLKAELG